MKIRLKGDEKLIVVDYRKKPQTRKPEIPYGYELALVFEFYHDNDTAYTEAELSAYTSFQFAMDKDFNFSTNPPVLANNSTTTFVISGNTISFIVMTDIADLKTLLDDSPSIEAYAEFKAYKPGKTRPGLGPVFGVIVSNAVAADGSEVPAASPELYITGAEAYALVQEAPDFEFSIDGATLWHTPQVDADLYYREQRNGGEWSEATKMPIGPQGETPGFIEGTFEHDEPDETGIYVITHTQGDITLPFRITGADGYTWYPYVQMFENTIVLDFQDYIPLDAGTWKYVFGGLPGATGTGVAPRGTYAAGTNYALDDGASYDGSYYRSKIADNIGNQPDTSPTEWELMVAGVAFTPENVANKGVANGYASLGANGKLPASQQNDNSVTRVKADIAARDAITDMIEGTECWVIDASTDASVNSGAAKYLYNGSSWIKTAESESLDVITEWSNISLKPQIITDIAAITGSDDDIIQKVSGSWVSRTMAQLKTVLGLSSSDVGLGNVSNESKSTMFSSPNFTGNVGINTTATAKLHIKGNSSDSSTYAFQADDSSDDLLLSIRNDGQTVVKSITITGGVFEPGSIYSSSSWGMTFRPYVIGTTASFGWFDQGGVEVMRMTLDHELQVTSGVLSLKETTTPTALTDHCKIYAKADNKLYFQDGAGVEHEIQLV